MIFRFFLMSLCLAVIFALTPLHAVAQDTQDPAAVTEQAEQVGETTQADQTDQAEQASETDQPKSGVDLGSTEIYEKSLKALTILLVAAVLIENALAVLFNWRVFLTYFSLRGIKTIVSVAVSFIVVRTFDLDVMGDLLGVYVPGSIGKSGAISAILTTLILSGGSGGVNSLMVSLGYRDRGRNAQVNPKAPDTEAWIAVRVTREVSVGPVYVHVTEVKKPTTDPSAIAGTIGFRRPSLPELLIRNSNRFPANGGHSVVPGTVYKIEVVGRKADGTEISAKTLAPEYRFAARAIVDFEVTL